MRRKYPLHRGSTQTWRRLITIPLSRCIGRGVFRLFSDRKNLDAPHLLPIFALDGLNVLLDELRRIFRNATHIERALGVGFEMRIGAGERADKLPHFPHGSAESAIRLIHEVRMIPGIFLMIAGIDEGFFIFVLQAHAGPAHREVEIGSFAHRCMMPLCGIISMGCHSS